MASIFVIAGHGAGDPGACGNGYSEAERVRALAERIGALGGNDVLLGDMSRDYYADNGIGRLGISTEYQIVELHMDSSGADARGGHVVINGYYPPDEYDIALAECISGIFPGRADTIVGRTDLANPNRAAAKGYGYRLIECGFISNAEDVDIFNSRMDDIARGILRCFGIAAVSSNTGSVTAPSRPSGGGATAGRKALGKVNATYMVQTGGDRWWEPITNFNNTDCNGFAGAGDGVPITGIAVNVDRGSVRYRGHVLGGDWLPWVTGYDTGDFDNGWAGDGRVLDAVEIYYTTPEGYEYQQARYRVSPIGSGAYYDFQIDDFKDSGMDGYAGEMGVGFDKLQLYIDG